MTTQMKMTREQIIKIVTVEKIIADAHSRNEQPDFRDMDLSGLYLCSTNLRGANLSNVNLCNTDLSRADLRGANFYGSDLWNANLRNTDLRGANLGDTNLWDTNFRDADLRDANLSGANMCGSDLQDADLRGANLHDADFVHADLRETVLCGLFFKGLPSGNLIFIPTPEGWHLTIDCWNGTVDELRKMIAQDHSWPDAQGKEIYARRPMLEGVIATCDAYAAAHSDALDEVKATAERWKNTQR